MDGGSGDLMAQPAKPQSADGPMAGVPVEGGGGSLNGVDKFPMTNGIGDEKPQVNNIHRENKSKENIDASREKHREKDRHRDKDRHKDKHRDKDREKDRHRDKDRDKHREKDREKHREKDKHSSSSSSSKDKHKDGTSSSSSKPGSSSSKSKDGSSSSSKLSSSSSSKDKHSSSSEKQKEHSSSSSKEKNRDKENRDKDKHKSSSSSSSHSAEKKESASIKKEPGSGDAAPLAIKVETLSPSKIKKEPPSSQFKAEDSDDDIPLSSRKELVKKEKESPIKKQSPVKKEKRALPESDEDDVPLSARADKVKKVKKEEKKTAKRKADDSEDDMPLAKRKKDSKDKKKDKNKAKTGGTGTTPKKKKKEEENVQTWKWWEEEKREDGVKWKFLEHKGPVFAAPYEKLPSDVNFYYNGKKMKLSDEAEEVAGFYGRMLDNDYTTKEIFNKNFFKDWRKVMTSDERAVITDLKKCNFKEMDAYYKQKSEERKNMSKEEKNKIKEENARLQEEYGFCTMDGYRQKIGNFKIEPPGLFRGRGEHPKQGMLKKRIVPEDVTINCSKDSQVPEPPKGHKWKEVRHDNAVTWLATWTENIQGQNKYVMLNPSSKIKGEKDWQKYETARRLHKLVDRIRANYREDFKSKEMRIRQRSVALYFIDKLALRAGNEKDEDQADTVGCCSLRVEHINLFENDDGQENVVEFDFLGKDSIRYTNKVSVEKRVFKNLQLFMQNKADGDDLFDRLNTSILNKHLQELMDGLTAKVFRTYNASRTLQEQLDLLTNADDPIAAKILAYNRANRAVAVLCNHQRAAPKNFDKQMENMKSKIEAKKDTIKEAKKAVKDAKSDYKASKSESKKGILERKKKALARLEEQLVKLEVQLTDKDENKEIALGTSKLNYLDPRISVAWCKKWDVPIEKVYNKTQREKFAWAIDMAEADYTFVE